MTIGGQYFVVLQFGDLIFTYAARIDRKNKFFLQFSQRTRITHKCVMRVRCEKWQLKNILALDLQICHTNNKIMRSHTRSRSVRAITTAKQIAQPSLKWKMPMYNQDHLLCNEWNLHLFLEKSLMHVVGYVALSLIYHVPIESTQSILANIHDHYIKTLS